MYIKELVWDNYRIEHIARHDVEPHEVQEVCDDPNHWAHRQGQTIAGRYLLIILERQSGNQFEPITARDLTPSERSNLRKLQK